MVLPLCVDELLCVSDICRVNSADVRRKPYKNQFSECGHGDNAVWDKSIASEALGCTFGTILEYLLLKTFSSLPFIAASLLAAHHAELKNSPNFVALHFAA